MKNYTYYLQNKVVIVRICKRVMVDQIMVDQTRI